jgi:hypothetical protein
MTYAVEIRPGAMTYIRSFIQFGSGIQKLMGRGGFRDRQKGELISLLLFSKISKVD